MFDRTARAGIDTRSSLPLARRRRFRPSAGAALTAMAFALGLGGSMGATAAALEGERQIRLHPREGPPVTIGTVNFTPADEGRSRFSLQLNPAAFTDYFLSMKEFKCLQAPAEVFCHVPYPYPQPGTLTAQDLAWLEHSLLFLFKLPREFGAKLWNGVYWQLSIQGDRLEGKPQAVDLNRISAPPDQPEQPPFRKALRDELPDDARWFGRLTIE